MSTLTIEVHCPRCGGDVERVTQSKNGFGARIVAKCVGKRSCRYEFVVNLDVIYARTNEDGEPTKCGTEGGFMRHKRANENACDQCRRAHVEAELIRVKKQRMATA